MKCFTVINDENPYHGISISPSGKTGVLGNFCAVANRTVGQPPITISPSKLIGRRLHIPQNGLYGILENADVMEEPPMGETYPVFTAPLGQEVPGSILIYWAIREDTGWGPITSGKSNNPNFTKYEETGMHPPYRETLFVLLPEQELQITFKYGKAITVKNEQGEPKIIRR